MTSGVGAQIKAKNKLHVSSREKIMSHAEPTTRNGRIGRERVLAGLCRQCGKPREKQELQYCNAHQEYYKTLAAKRYQERKASGRCVYRSCDKPTMANYVHCEAHNELVRARMYKRSKAKRGNP